MPKPLKMKRAHRKVDAEAESEQYLHCMPLEAVTLSKSGKALGYDLLRWGERFHAEGNDSGFVAATATAAGILFHVQNQLERNWVNDVERDDPDRGRTMAARRRFIESRNFYPWQALTGLNKDFVLSLLWIPEEPLSPLEALAQAADG